MQIRGDVFRTVYSVCTCENTRPWNWGNMYRDTGLSVAFEHSGNREGLGVMVTIASAIIFSEQHTQGVKTRGDKSYSR